MPCAHKTGTSYDTAEAPSLGSLCSSVNRPARSHQTRRSLTRWIPSAQNDPSIGGLTSNLVDAFLELVDALPCIIGIAIDVRHAEMTPLEPIDGAQIALTAVSQPAGFEERLRAVAVPDLDAALREEGRVGFSADEPEELFDDAAEVGAFGGEEGQGCVGEGEAEGGRCEEGVCAGAGAVIAGFAVGDGALDEGKVLVLFVGHGGGGKERDATRRADYVYACVTQRT